METKTKEEEKEAGDIRETQTQEFTEGDVDFWVENFDDDIGAIVEGSLYEIRRDTGAIGNLCYIKKVNGHLEIGPVKKIEIIY